MKICLVIFKHCEGRKNTAAVALGKAFEKRMQKVCNFFYGVYYIYNLRPICACIRERLKIHVDAKYLSSLKLSKGNVD